MSVHTADRIVRVAHARGVVDERYLFEKAFTPATDDEIVIEGKRYRPHLNGGGLVSVTAFVGSRVFVAETARVEDRAIVLDTVRVLDRAVIAGNATVADRCELRGDSRVGGFATLVGMVTLRRHARVDGTARLEGGIVIDCVTHISRGHLFGPLAIG